MKRKVGSEQPESLCSDAARNPESKLPSKQSRREGDMAARNTESAFVADRNQEENGIDSELPVTKTLHDQVPARSMFTAELCCASAGLTLKLTRCGFQGLAVDHEKNRHKPKVPCVHLDLSSDSGWEILCRLLAEKRLFYVDGAPPCGAATRAREKPLSEDLIAAGVHEPKPLRSEEFPRGLPGLTGVDAERVLQANLVYERMAQFLLAYHEAGVYWSVENPSRSYLWLTRWFRRLLRQKGAFEVKFHQCMHGGRRDKLSSWWTNMKELQSLARMCSKDHKHLPWGGRFQNNRWQFNTAEEAPLQSRGRSGHGEGGFPGKDVEWPGVTPTSN